jgi:glutathionyl-hydroquinone reductase
MVGVRGMDMGRGSRESKPAYVKTIMHTNVTEEKHTYTPTRTHIYRHARPGTGVQSAVFIVSSHNTSVCTNEQEQICVIMQTEFRKARAGELGTNHPV